MMCKEDMNMKDDVQGGHEYEGRWARMALYKGRLRYMVCFMQGSWCALCKGAMIKESILKGRDDAHYARER